MLASHFEIPALEGACGGSLLLADHSPQVGPFCLPISIPLDAEKAPKNRGYYRIKSALEKHRAQLPGLVEEWKEAERVRDALKTE